MKKLLLILVIVLAGKGIQAQNISLNQYSAIPGNTISLALEADDFQNLGAITLFIQFDTLVLSFDSVSQVNASVSDLLVNMMPAESSLGIAWSASASGISFSEDTICLLHFTYLGGDCELIFLNYSEFADFSAGIINVNYSAGSVSPYFEAQIEGLAADFCITDPTVSLSGTPNGGYFYIDLIEGTEFSPSTAGPGLHEIKYVYTNSYGISDTAVQMVTVHSIPSWSLEYTNPACNGFANGSINLLVNAGTPPFVYQWSNGSSDASVGNLPAGIYYFTITGAFCSASSSITLIEPDPIELFLEMTPASSVAQLDGAISSFVSGGISPFNYVWSDGETTANISGKEEGFYSLTVSDDNECQVSAEIYLRAFASQTIVFPAQWSIFSMNIEPVFPEISIVLGDLGSGVEIVKDESGAVYWPQFGVDGIGDTEIGEGYMIRMVNSDTLTISGYYLHPEDYTITLPINWSIIGYLRISPSSIISLLNPVVSSVSIVKNSNGAVYWPQYNLNMIGNLNPGEGYQIKMIQPAIYFYPPND